jgi:hypothetical protein
VRQQQCIVGYRPCNWTRLQLLRSVQLPACGTPHANSLHVQAIGRAAPDYGSPQDSALLQLQMSAWQQPTKLVLQLLQHIHTMHNCLGKHRHCVLVCTPRWGAGPMALMLWLNWVI